MISNAARPVTLAGLASWLRLIGRLQFLLLPLFFAVLPFTALRRVWAHDLLGGMFAELSAGQVFLTVLPLVLCAWSTMLVVGLLVEGSKLDPPPALPAWSGVFDLPPRTVTDNRWGEGAAAHHMIDGGYNENYGVASVLDFLTPVMRARARRQLRFRRLLIVQLRAWNAASPVGGSAPGIVASLAGPLIGVLSVRDGATLPRNQSALQQFIDLWDGQDGVAVRSIVFEPARPDAAGGADDEEPLSWHMTETQKTALRNRWFAQTDRNAKLCAMLAFLDGRDSSACGPSAADQLEGRDRPDAP